MDKHLENDELIEKYEDLGLDINKIFMELVSRFKNKELTEVEWGRVCDIGSRRASELVDCCNVGKEDLKKGFSRVADILSDENR